MSTLLSRLHAAAQSGLTAEASIEMAQAKAAAAQAAAFEANAQATFLECQNVALRKLRSLNPRPRIEAGHYRVKVLEERCTPFGRTPLVDCVQALFQAEGIQTDRCYGGNELYTGCELILVIPVVAPTAP